MVLAAAALAAWCGWLSGFHRSTTPARVSWAFSLAAVVVVDVFLWRRRGAWRAARGWPGPGRGRWSALAGSSPWVALAVVVAVWDILGLATSGHEAHLTISALTQAFRPLDAAMLLVWMTVGVGFGVVRARAPRGGDLRGPVPPGAGPAALLASSVVALGRHSGRRRAGSSWVGALLPDSRSAGVAFWLGLVAAVVVLDQLSRRSNGRLANAEEFVRLVTGPMPARVIWVVAWAYAGYHLFAH